VELDMKDYRFGSWNLAAVGGLCVAAFATACGPGSSSTTPSTAGGGGGGGGDCGSVQPCGGDVVGTWDIVSGCVPLADGGAIGTVTINGQACSGVAAVSESINVQGTLTFDSNSGFTETVTQFGATVTLSIPGSCFPGTTCDQLGAVLAQDAGASLTSVTCTGTTTCLCTSIDNAIGSGGAISTPLSETGTYSISGSSLTFTTALDGGGIGQSSGDYCVVGNELHSIGVATSMNMGAMGTVVIESDIVARKR
jgi:hypothetical protein